MAKFLYKLGTFIAKHKGWSVFAWVVLLAVILTPLALNTPKFDNDITMSGLKSLDTNDKVEDEFGQDSEKASVRIVFKSNSDGDITKKETKEDIQEALDNIKKDDDYVQSITDPYDNKQISKDKSTAFADVNYVVSQSSLKDKSVDNINEELDDLKDKHLIQTELSGNEDFEIGATSEVVGVVIALIVLLITFGTFIAAGMPIISAIFGLGSSIGIIALLTYTFDIPNVTLTLAIMIGLAVGIDYALFILFRYKQIVKTQTDHIKAIGLAIGTAGSAVIFAGITVIIAVCGLALVGIDFLAVMGFASAISVFLAVLSALTLLPALISMFHRKIQPKSHKSERSGSVDTPWSKFVVGKPFLATFIGLAILALAIIPASHMRLGMPDEGMNSDKTTQKKAYDIISDKFGEGFNGQMAMLVNVKDENDQDALNRDLQHMTDDIKDLDNVDMVTPPQLSKSNDYALIGIIPEEGPNAESTNDLVYDLRDYNDQAQDQYNFDTAITGQSVINIDMSKKLNDAIPVFAGVIVLLAFILLMIVFRSLIIPLKAVLGFVLSLAATLGFTTLIMQDGFMSGLFGIGTPGPLLAFLPVIVIGLLFGLAMDYEVFLMSRIHEEYSKTRNNAYAIKVGIKESGPVIVAAALIMFSVFIAFVFQEDVMIKSMGLALAFGVLFDAFIVRMMIIPALTQLFGNASWYFPKWLDRILPKVDIEGHGLQEETSSGQMDLAHPYQSAGMGDKQLSHIPDIAMDDKTERLYNDLLNASSDRSALFNGILFNALIQYAKDNNREIYDKYVSQAGNDGSHQQHADTESQSSKMKQDPIENMDNSDIMKLLSQQNKNVEKINEILSKIVDREDDESK